MIFLYCVARYEIFENVPKKLMELVNDFARYSQKTANVDSDPMLAYRYREGAGAGVAHRRFAGKGRRFAAPALGLTR